MSTLSPAHERELRWLARDLGIEYSEGLEIACAYFLEEGVTLGSEGDYSGTVTDR